MCKVFNSFVVCVLVGLVVGCGNGSNNSTYTDDGSIGNDASISIMDAGIMPDSGTNQVCQNHTFTYNYQTKVTETFMGMFWQGPPENTCPTVSYVNPMGFGSVNQTKGCNIRLVNSNTQEFRTVSNFQVHGDLQPELPSINGESADFEQFNAYDLTHTSTISVLVPQSDNHLHRNEIEDLEISFQPNASVSLLFDTAWLLISNTENHLTIDVTICN